MRSRLIVPAALLIAAAYMKGRWDAQQIPAAPALEPVSPRHRALSETAATALAPAPAAYADALDLANLSEWVAAPVARLRPHGPPSEQELAVLSEWSAPVTAGPAWHGIATVVADAPVPALVVVQVDESGRFLVGGWAAAAGHTAFCGVTFRERREDGIPLERIRLVVEAADNVAGDGPIVLGDPGFAPDREGFTIVVAAGAPGRFAAAGRYELLT